ncbi:hypothetical protein GGR52DRAFT_586087 [Hypoxylon sp. FL1284]|nr:hypothetical protein GGR52DRAFT_586087 [Hypoxylon sp. FL1284]
MGKGPSHSGPFGQACTNCFKSKSKYVARSEGDGCQKCSQLNKQCRPSDSLRRRTIVKKPTPSNNRIAHLESKLYGLVSQLQERNIIDGNAATRHQDVPGPSSQTDSTTSATAVEEARDIVHAEDEDNASNVRSDGLPEPEDVAMSEPPNLRVPEAEAELTADRLKCDRPLLFCAIICVASPSVKEKAAQSRELKLAICKARAGCRSEASEDKMDLLLCLLTYIAWGWDYVLNRCSLSSLMRQAMSLVFEMPLDKPISSGAQAMQPFTPGSDAWSNTPNAKTTRGFRERQRAVLMCFVLSSVVAAYFGQIEALPARQGQRTCPRVPRGAAREAFDVPALVAQVVDAPEAAGQAAAAGEKDPDDEDGVFARLAGLVRAIGEDTEAEMTKESRAAENAEDEDERVRVSAYEEGSVGGAVDVPWLDDRSE